MLHHTSQPSRFYAEMYRPIAKLEPEGLGEGALYDKGSSNCEAGIFRVWCGAHLPCKVQRRLIHMAEAKTRRHVSATPTAFSLFAL